MKKVFTELEKLFKKHSTILNCIEEVEILRALLKKPADIEKFVNLLREKVQAEAVQAIFDNNGVGIIAMATGSGKSKVAIDVAKIVGELNPMEQALIVPTEKLRDENWREEFSKWGANFLWERTERLCYASASKIKEKEFSVVILDEGHNLTELGSEFFINNKVHNCILLTATPPTDPAKKEILKALHLNVIYHLTLDQAVRLGFVAPYKITVVTVPLNAVDKDVVGGTKKVPFMTTEQKTSEYLNRTVQQCMFDNTPSGKARMKFAILRRMQFIYKLKSKTAIIKFLLDKVIPEKDRTLIFCGNIAQAEEVSTTFYHSKSGDKDYNAFKAETLNRLSCVKAINEGHNFPGVDSAIIGQLNSKEKDLIQRIGRIIRYRPGHEAHIWIVVSEGTQDEKWLESALTNLDATKIEYIRSLQLLTKYEG